MMDESSSKTMGIENLTAMNEMMKRIEGKETTFDRMKRLKVASSNRAFADSQCNGTNLHEPFETLLDKDTHQPERILAVTAMDELCLFICYLVRYTNGQLELVPNKIVHRHCPQMVIDFLESNLIFSNKRNSNLPANLFRGIEFKEFNDNRTKDSKAAQNDDYLEDDNFYMFDELSKCFNMNNLKDIIKPGPSSSRKQPETSGIDFTKLDTGSDISTSQIHKLSIPDNMMSKSIGTSKSMITDKPLEMIDINNGEDSGQEEISLLERQELEFVNSIFDQETIEELEENMMDENDDDESVSINEHSYNQEREPRTPGLNDINETLLLSYHRDSQEDDESQELSSISPDIMDELLKSNDNK